MKEFDAKAIALKLTELIKQKNIRCPFCKGIKFILIDAYSRNRLVDANQIPLDKGIPVVTVICNKCGHVDMFSAGILGLTKEEKKVRK